MILRTTTRDEYDALIVKDHLSVQEKFRLSSYPYISLLDYCKDNIYGIERDKIRQLEDNNISHFLRLTGLFFGIGSKREVELLNQSILTEPLRSAVIAARQEPNPTKRTILFIEKGVKILLSLDKKGSSFFNAINVGLDGKMPFRPFSSSLQSKGNEWFDNFVDLKLKAMNKVFLSFGSEDAYSFFVSSIAYSLYSFCPSRYHITFCRSEDEALHKVLNVFFEIINNYKK